MGSSQLVWGQPLLPVTSSYRYSSSSTNRAVLLGHSHTSDIKSHPRAGGAEPTHTTAAHCGRSDGVCVSALGTVAAQDASAWLLWQHQKYGRDGESSPTTTALSASPRRKLSALCQTSLARAAMGT